MRQPFLAVLLVGLMVVPAAAQSVPPPRPDPRAAAMASPVPLPRPRPAPLAGAEARTGQDKSATPAEAPATAPGGPINPTAAPAAGASPPPRVYQTACPAVIDGTVTAKALPPIADGACAEQSPWSVTEVLVNGRRVPVSAPVTVNCQMATALPAWLDQVDAYLFATQKTRIKTVDIGESYVCRPRHTPEGSGDLSEHGRADAVDFVGLTLEDGRTLTVSADYGSADPTLSKPIRFAHEAACGNFTTVLGPDANSLHHDHFHLDLGCHGHTCTYRLCE